MLDYTIVEGASSEVSKFEAMINEFLEDGWKVDGELVVVPCAFQEMQYSQDGERWRNATNYAFFQRMIK